MLVRPENDTRHILILGAGASVDYGLPTWKKLDRLIKDKIDDDKNNLYKHKEEILVWLNKIGESKEDKQYETIDECITEESEKYNENGLDVENQIFTVMRDIFEEKYLKDADGWIKVLNEKILENGGSTFEQQIAFINYNYDDVLGRKFLDYKYVSQKRRLTTRKNRLDELSNIVVDVLHPHGKFNIQQKDINPHLRIHIDTDKSYNQKYLDAISCHESRTHRISPYHNEPIKLYILGLGYGLQINLDNIQIDNPISEVHVTVHDKSMKDKILDYLSKKYNIPSSEIKVYSSCEDLVEKCF